MHVSVYVCNVYIQIKNLVGNLDNRTLLTVIISSGSSFITKVTNINMDVSDVVV